MPKVSVIIPVYGVEKYIERCARSLFEQTLDDIEYIFVDDCSPDRSMEILDRIIDEYRPRFAGEGKVVRIERMPTNSGLPAVRRHGIQLATGDYTIHCDSDDWVDVTMYEKMYNKAIEEDADIVICDFVHAYSDGRRIVMPQKPAALDGKTLIHQMLFQQLHGSCWNKLVRRACYKEDIVFPKENMTEDLVVMTQIALTANKICYVANALYNYFLNIDSISKSNTEKAIVSRYKGIVENTNLIINFIIKNNLSDEFAEDIVYKKYGCKEALNELLHEKRYRDIWRNTYPDINTLYIRNKYIRCNSKIRGLCILNNMYWLYVLLMKIKKFR